MKAMVHDDSDKLLRYNTTIQNKTQRIKDRLNRSVLHRIPI